MNMRRAGAIFLVVLLAPAGGAAQVGRAPRIGAVYPAGARRGAVTEIEIAGRYLDDPRAVEVSGGGVEALVLEHLLPLTPPREKALADRAAREAAEGITPGVKVTLVRKRRGPDAQLNAELEEALVVRVTVAADARPGARDIRLVTPGGASNPLVFHVGDLPECRETEPNDDRSDRTDPGDFPFVLNGRILPGDADLFRFRATRGQALVFRAQARALVPYQADSVPGWFQAVLALYDADGWEVAYADDYRFDPDPVLFYDVPADGDYVLEIRDAIYRGREDFVYRVTAGELPFVTAHFPLGGSVARETTVALAGRNLAAASHVVAPGPTPGIGVFQAAGRGGAASNPLRFQADTLPEALESEPNDGVGQAGALVLPVVVNGRVQAPGDRDTFSFAGRAGQEVVAEVFARRLGSPLDATLELLGADGRPLAFNDDWEDPAFGLLTDHADARLAWTLPADGRYAVRLSDTRGKGGDEYAYRLRLGPPNQDFALHAVPSTVTMGAGASAVVTVRVLRRAGFAGAIALSLEGVPGFTLDGAEIPAGVETARLTITAPPETAAGGYYPRLTGTADIAGRRERRPVVPADEMMQAFSYRHLVPAREFCALVSGPVPFTLSPTLAPGARLRIPRGGSVELAFEVRREPGVPGIALASSEPPVGLSVSRGRVMPAASSGRLTVSAAADAPAGLRGNLFVTGVTAVERRRHAVTAPAIPFEVVE